MYTSTALQRTRDILCANIVFTAIGIVRAAATTPGGGCILPILYLRTILDVVRCHGVKYDELYNMNL